MKQIRSAKRQRSQSVSLDDEIDNEIILQLNSGSSVMATAIIGFAVAGAIEGIIAYAFLLALNNAEVWDVSPRPLFMVSAGIAWRFLRGIDQSMRS